MKDLQTIFDNSKQLYSMTDIDEALDRLAASLTEQYANSNPVILCVMNGSVITTGHLLPKLSFPLELDYIHLTRYGEKTIGGELNWLHKPTTELASRTVILIEDIFDEGVTLQALRKYCEQAGAKSVSCVSLIDKAHENKVGLPPEFIGLTVPDCYVFGFGMDYQGYWRNAPGIYAVEEID
ncbi:MAG: hypoxanthine-guanine phosphoribosyltransferase [Gammaproteobacteria bacterium]|nr:MAG: hypoxanthine-guanine phosphoribosyltransferase [Gammaproteobacteria bacterium]RKZ96367.1 MAG: hypoxanthine-guanine phosphoribosyltransferase [Gammaproteobacteria bacterium]RKZ97070.1 MAG: hypoxanthine-guanine phosphoribosyltransferase [Gammaproteobacteria bacterium]RLA00071.1 MAG: hypoxanthine-guanine phosphoribosyltransferase [Gammaproteobacteria bacterium]